MCLVARERQFGAEDVAEDVELAVFGAENVAEDVELAVFGAEEVAEDAELAVLWAGNCVGCGECVAENVE